MDKPKITDKEFAALGKLVDTFFSKSKKTWYARPSRFPDGDAGWADNWYALKGGKWKQVTLPPEDVEAQVEEDNPY